MYFGSEYLVLSHICYESFVVIVLVTDIFQSLRIKF